MELKMTKAFFLYALLAALTAIASAQYYMHDQSAIHPDFDFHNDEQFYDEGRDSSAFDSFTDDDMDQVPDLQNKDEQFYDEAQGSSNFDGFADEYNDQPVYKPAGFSTLEDEDAMDAAVGRAGGAGGGRSGGGFGSRISSASRGIRSAISRAASNVRSRVAPAVRNIQSRVSQATRNIKSRVGPAVRNIQSRVSQATRNIKSRAAPAVRNIQSRISQATRNIKSRVGPAVRNVKSRVSQATRNIKSRVGPAVRNVKSRVSQATRNIKSRVGPAAKNVRESTGKVANKAKAALVNAGKKASQMGAQAKKSLSKAANNVKNMVKITEKGKKAGETANTKVTGKFKPQFANKGVQGQREAVLLNAVTNAKMGKVEAAQFLAQMAHESDQFRAMREYSSGRQYEGRKDLGNTRPGDGEKYAGRGYIQLTGRANYEHFGKKIGVDLVNNPQKASDPKIAAKIALAYWNERVKPRVTDFRNTQQVTRIINGGYNGLNDRVNKFSGYNQDEINELDDTDNMVGGYSRNNAPINTYADVEDIWETA